MGITLPEPNPRRRPMTVPTPPPVGRRAGIMALPQRKPTRVERTMANREPALAQLFAGTRGRGPDGRTFGERMAEGADVIQGVGAGMLAGLAGLPADLTALAFGDIPAIVNKLVTGESVNQEESPYFRQLNEFRDAYGAEAVLRAMGLGDKIDAPSDSPDALSQMGVNPFRQGAFAGEFLADPFLFLKAGKVAKAGMAGTGSRSTDALADAAAGDAAARAAADAELEAEADAFFELDDAPQTGSIVSTEPQVGFTGQVDTPPPQTAAETVIEGTVTSERTTPIRQAAIEEPGFVDPDAVMPMTASPDQVARITPPIRSMQLDELSLRDADEVTVPERRLIEENRAGSVVDYSPLFQRVSALPDNEMFSKSFALDALRGGSKESIEKDRRGSGFIEFLEKFAAGTLTRGEVISLYRKYTPQVRVRSISTTELNTDASSTGLFRGAPYDGSRLPDFNQKTFDGDRYGIPVQKLGFQPGTTDPEKLHVFFANPNSQLPLTADGSRTLQLESYSDHGFGVSRGIGRHASPAGKEGGVPGYYGHARFNAIQNDKGKIAVFQEGQTNQGVQEQAASRGEVFVNYTDNTLDAVGRQTRDGEEYVVVRLDKIDPDPDLGITTGFSGKVTDPNTGEAIPRGTQIVFPGISRLARAGLPRRPTLEPGVPLSLNPRLPEQTQDVLRVLEYFPEGREFLENNPNINFNQSAARRLFGNQRERTSRSTRADLRAPEFERLEISQKIPMAEGDANMGPTSILNKFREAYPDFTPENRLVSFRSRDGADYDVGTETPAAQMMANIRTNPTAPLADLVPAGYRPFRFNQAIITANGRDINAGDLVLLPEEFATTTGRSGQPLATEFFQPQTDRFLPDVQIEGRQVKTGEGPPIPKVVPFTGEERRLLEELRDISPEANRIFDEAANSSILKVNPDDDPFIRDFTAGQNRHNELFQQFEDDRLIIGGETPTAQETREILDAVNQNMTTIQPVAGGFREMTDLILEVVPARLAQLMEAADNTRMDQRLTVTIPGHEADNIAVSPYYVTLQAEVGDIAVDSLTRDTIGKLLLDDLTPEQVNKFNSAFLARLEDIESRNATVDDFQARIDFFEAEGGNGAALLNYEDVADEFKRFDEGDPNARSPHQYFRERGPANLEMYMRTDPGLFGHITNTDYVGTNTFPFNETSSDPRLIMSRAMRHRIKVALDEKLDDAIVARRPAGDQTLRDDVGLQESIDEMTSVIDGDTFPPVSAARKKEFKEAFETWANTIHRSGQNPRARSGYVVPGDRKGQDRIYTVSTPFVGRNASSDNLRHMYRAAIAEVEAAGFDGAVFPHWEDQYDARMGQGFKKPAAQRVYETELMAALKEAGYKVKADNRGPADVVLEPTIMARNTTTDVVEPMPHANTGNNHRPAIAIYFNQDRVRTRRYPRDERPATGEQTYDESIGTNRDMLVNPDGTRKLIRRAEGGPVDLRPKKLVHSGIGAMAKQVM